MMPGARIEVHWTWSSYSIDEHFPCQKPKTQKTRCSLDFSPVAPNHTAKRSNPVATLRRTIRQNVAHGMPSGHGSDKKSVQLVANLGSTFFPPNAIVFTLGSVRGIQSPRFRKSIDKKHRISYGEPR
jgi:hypothetical protein